MLKKIKRKNLKLYFFIVLFLLGSFYIVFVKSELYRSYVYVSIKDLNAKNSSLDGFSLFMPSVNSNLKDILILQTYLQSYEELKNLDQNFSLYKHYKSEAVDIVDRLKSWSTTEDFLKLYQKRLELIVDENTAMLEIGFLHTNPKVAYEIVNALVKDANDKINQYNKIVAQKQLSFIKKQVEKNKTILDKSIKKLEAFQNKYIMLDPEQTAQAKSTLVANLEASLIEKKAKLAQLRGYMNEKNFEIVRLKGEIATLKKTLKKMKHSLASKKSDSLNVYIFEYERLKSIVELNKELYKQALLQLEQIKMEVSKNSKMLLVLTKPYIPQGYTYPEKLKDIFTLMMILALLYGIITLLEAIVKEHLD